MATMKGSTELTWNKLEAELFAGGIPGTRTASTAWQPELKRRPIGCSVPVQGTDLDHGLLRRKILVDDGTIRRRKLWVIVVDIHQVYHQCSGTGLHRQTYSEQLGTINNILGRQVM